MCVSDSLLFEFIFSLFVRDFLWNRFMNVQYNIYSPFKNEFIPNYIYLKTNSKRGE